METIYEEEGLLFPVVRKARRADGECGAAWLRDRVKQRGSGNFSCTVVRAWGLLVLTGVLLLIGGKHCRMRCLQSTKARKVIDIRLPEKRLNRGISCFQR